MSAAGLPMYITETGVADHKDVLRPEMFDTYFNQVRQLPCSFPDWLNCIHVILFHIVK